MKDLVGQRFGRLVVVSFSHTGVYYEKFWNCICDCGNSTVVAQSRLIHERTKSCGCIQKEKARSARIDMTGERYGRLVVIDYAYSKFRSSWWNCKCDCGNTTIVTRTALISGMIRSCGCYGKDRSLLPPLSYTLDAAKRKIDNTLRAMISRCYNKKNKNYPNYGGRGIKICDRWLQKDTRFQNFLDDMGFPPNRKSQIDRIDNDGNYCKENCRWACNKENNRNRGNLRLLTHEGKTQCIAAWAEEKKINERTLHWRLKHWDSIAEALDTPLNLSYSRKQ